MREWMRCVAARLCGHCGKQLLAGDLVLVYLIRGVKQRKARCPDCAVEAPPLDLPPVVDKPGRTKRMQPLTPLVRQFQREELPKRLNPKLRQLFERPDSKMRQTGEEG